MRTVPQFAPTAPATIEIENSLLNAIGYDDELYNLVTERLNIAAIGKHFEVCPITDEDTNECWNFVICEYDECDTDGTSPTVWQIANIASLLDVRHTDEEASSRIEFANVTPEKSTNTVFYSMFQ